jgi:ABC-type sugar transport system permease subunit
MVEKESSIAGGVLPYTRFTVQRGRAWRRFSKATRGWAFVLPPLIVYAVFFIWPLGQSVYISFTDWNGVRPVVEFVGLANYSRMLRDPLVWRALWHNVIWIVAGTVSPIVISLGLAMLLWPRTRGQNLFQAAYFLPQILSTVAVGLIWSKVYHPMIGVLNQLLQGVGLGHLVEGWLGSSQWALAAVLVAAIWSYFGFTLVVIMAGLQTIDLDLLDAAGIDGANAWQRFVNVIVPQLSHVLTMIIAYTLIGGFNVFDIIWVMTGGGPANATEVMATLLYQRAFMEDNVAYGVALAMVLTVLSLIASVTFIYLREREG